MDLKKIVLILILTTTVLTISAFLLYVVNYDVKNIFNDSLSNIKTLKLKTARRAHRTAFDLYLKKFNKSYDSGEYEIRLAHFKRSLKEISRLNSLDPNVYGLTIFSDWSKKEFSRLMLRTRRYSSDDCTRCQKCASGSNTSACNVRTTKLPEKFDWRDSGFIGPVLNQDQCAACWAFSIAGVMESMAAIRGMGYTRLSIQEVLDCVKGRSHGCNGTEEMEGSLRFMCDANMFVTTENQYPLTLVDESCPGKYVWGRRIKDYWAECAVNETKILNWIVNHGPVIAIVNADPWMNYNGGIIQRSCVRSHDKMTIDHAIQIVGFDRTGSVPYYIVRNSWGKSFGIDGYVKLAINKNICGIAEEVYILDVV